MPQVKPLDRFQRLQMLQIRLASMAEHVSLRAKLKQCVGFCQVTTTFPTLKPPSPYPSSNPNPNLLTLNLTLALILARSPSPNPNPKPDARITLAILTLTLTLTLTLRCQVTTNIQEVYALEMPADTQRFLDAIKGVVSFDVATTFKPCHYP